MINVIIAHFVFLTNEKDLQNEFVRIPISKEIKEKEVVSMLWNMIC